MLTLIVSTLDGHPLAAEVRGKFGVLGGTIGAIEGNTIVLADPQNRIAPLEANIVAGPQGYIIRNFGAKPLYVNGRPVATSGEAVIEPGAYLAIGPFVMQVAPEAAP